MNKIGLYFLAILAGASVVMAADEITIQATMRVSNGNFELTRSVGSLSIDQTGRAMSYGIQTITTNSTTLVVGSDVTTGGYSWFRNVGTNAVTVQVYMLLNPSDIALLPVASTNITAYTSGTNSEATFLEYWINQE
jgi:hypothetical protein